MISICNPGRSAGGGGGGDGEGRGDLVSSRFTCLFSNDHISHIQGGGGEARR